MNHLPEFWAVKIYKEHPLFLTFQKTIIKEFDEQREKVWNEWDYVVKDTNDGILNFSRNPDTHICRFPILLTIEQFLQQETYSIY